MNAYSSLSYAQPAAPTRTARAAEYEVIAQITRRLSSAIALRKGNYPAFIAALADNEQLWSTLAADVAGGGNGLPQALRARLFYLYRFTAEHSRKIRAGTAGAEVLVEINTAVLRGLRGEGLA
ncbi:flagellar biosynthesis regulator FlaF [Rhodobacter sp.]